MAKKQNIYSTVDANKLEKEISSIIEYLEMLDVENLVDDILWKPTAKGGIAPSVVSTIEKKILTALRIVNQSGNIALALYEKEKQMTVFLEHMMATTINTLKSIQEYYDKQPISKIQHRFITEVTQDKKGNSKSITFLANSKEDQIAARASITEKILQILPVIEKMEKVQDTEKLKGDKELIESFMYD